MALTKELDLDLEGIPSNARGRVKRDVGEFVIEKILERSASGRGSVKGKTSWPKLNREYAEEQKGGDRTPNLELTGEMLDALQFREEGDKLVIGYPTGTDNDVLDKADGHNNHSGESDLPLRRFIPKGDESFTRDIESGINRILKRNKRGRQVEAEATPSPRRESSIGIDIRSLLTRDIFDRLFGNGES